MGNLRAITTVIEESFDILHLSSFVGWLDIALFNNPWEVSFGSKRPESSVKLGFVGHYGAFCPNSGTYGESRVGHEQCGPVESNGDG